MLKSIIHKLLVHKKQEYEAGIRLLEKDRLQLSHVSIVQLAKERIRDLNVWKRIFILSEEEDKELNVLVEFVESNNECV